MPCHIPSSNFELIIGIERLVLVKMLLMCAGISSGPSELCSYKFSSSETSLLKNDSISLKTAGSAFSCITKDAEVCLIYKVQF